MRKNCQGFTLVEIIVVVVILGVLTGIMSMSISAVFSGRAKRCASEIDAYISMCKVNCMSRAGDIYMVLDVNGDGCIRGSYYEDGVLKDSAVFSASNVGASFTIGGTTTALSPTDTLKLSFDRNTGGFKPQASGSYCTDINVSCGRTYTITLIPSTGNHTIS